MTKRYFLLLLLAACGTLPSSHVAWAHESKEDVVYPPFDCQGVDGRHPNPYDCSSFYECISNTAILIRCPLGKLYNSEIPQCDFPQNVDCSNISPLPAYSTYPTTLILGSAEFTCPSPDGYFPDPDLCNVFYICYQGIPNRHDCPDGLIYNPEIFACDYPSNVPPPCGTQCSLPIGNCESTTTTETTPSTTTGTTTTTKPPFRCPAQDGFFVNPDSCSSYYVCNEWQDTLLQCSPGLVYNPSLFTCDYTYNVPPPCGTCDTCPGGEQTTTSPTTTTRTTSTTTRPIGGGPFDCPTPNGYFADPESCTSFYICYNWESNIRYCAEGLVFNPAKETCDYPYNVPPPCGTARTKI